MLLDSRQVCNYAASDCCLHTNWPPSEIPSARLRALNVALAAATQWLFNFIVARSEFVLYNMIGTY
jgi:hypothetical protein